MQQKGYCFVIGVSNSHLLMNLKNACLKYLQTSRNNTLTFFSLIMVTFHFHRRHSFFVHCYNSQVQHWMVLIPAMTGLGTVACFGNDPDSSYDRSWHCDMFWEWSWFQQWQVLALWHVLGMVLIPAMTGLGNVACFGNGPDSSYDRCWHCGMFWEWSWFQRWFG